MKSLSHEGHEGLATKATKDTKIKKLCDLRALCGQAFVFFVVSSGGAAAHHGTQAFDITKTLALRGTIVDVEYVNPHVELRLDVLKDDRVKEQWTIALSPPSAMVRKGVARDAIKRGAVMTVTGYASTTIERTLTAIEFTLPDGRSFATGNASFNPIDTSFPRELPATKR